MSVESSLAEINFVNLYDEKKTSKVKQKETFYVHNRFGSSKKLKITLSKTSHSVNVDNDWCDTATYNAVPSPLGFPPPWFQ